jgi:glucokinase
MISSEIFIGAVNKIAVCTKCWLLQSFRGIVGSEQASIKRKRMKLVAVDIGGTTARFVLADSQRPISNHLQAVNRYDSQSFADFGALLTAYLVDAGLQGSNIDLLCLALPGLINGQQARLTNLPWVLDADDIRRRFNVSRVLLVNDFQAACEGLDSLQADDVVSINTGHRQADRPRVITGVGTGLGMAWQLPDSSPQVTEGGHVDFAPVDEQQDRLLQYLRKSYPAHVSYERILSGPGLVMLYQFVSTEAGMQQDSEISPAAVSSRAAQGDEIAIDAMRLFVRILAGFAGNLAMLFQPFAGLYIAGGIAPKIQKWLNSDEFIEYYSAKGRMSSLILRVPVILITNENVGLQGALSYAYKSIHSQGKR